MGPEDGRQEVTEISWVNEVTSIVGSARGPARERHNLTHSNSEADLNGPPQVIYDTGWIPADGARYSLSAGKIIP